MSAAVYQNSATRANGTSSTSQVADLPTGIAAGDFLLAQVTIDDGAPSTVSTPSGWRYATDADNSSHSCRTYVFWRIADGTEGTTATFTTGSSRQSNTAVSRWTGVNPVNPINATATYASPSSVGADVRLSLTTTIADCVLVGLVGKKTTTASSNLWSPPSGFTEAYDVTGTLQIAIESAYKTQTTAGATGTQTWTCSDGGYMHGAMVALAPALGSVASGTTNSITLPTGWAAGEVCLLAIVSEPFNGDPAHSDWTVLARQADSDSRLQISVFSRTLQSGDTSWTFTSGGGFTMREWATTRWYGGTTFTPTSGAGAAFGATSLVLPSLSATASSTLVALAGGREGAAHAATGPASMTKQYQVSSSVSDAVPWTAMFSEPVTSAGSTGTRTLSWGYTGDRWAGVMLDAAPAPPTSLGGASATGSAGGTRTAKKAATGGASSAAAGGGAQSITRTFAPTGGGAAVASGSATHTALVVKAAGAVAVSRGGGLRAGTLAGDGGAVANASGGGWEAVGQFEPRDGGAIATASGGGVAVEAHTRRGGGSGGGVGGRGAVKVTRVFPPSGAAAHLIAGGHRAVPQRVPWVPRALLYDEQIARFGFSTSQRLLAAGTGLQRPPFSGTCGWHGTFFDARRGAYAIASADGVFADLVGERVKLTYYKDPTRPRSVIVYIYSEALPCDDLTIPRAMFMRLAPLSSDVIRVVAEVLA